MINIFIKVKDNYKYILILSINKYLCKNLDLNAI